MNEKNISKTFKVILVGDTNVGKTSIIRRYTKGQFCNINLTTVANSFSNKIININDQNINLQIWDTAGQERYRAISEIFFRNTDAIIFVYDITSKKSFDEISNFWYKSANENIKPKPILAIAGNKCDLFDREEVDDEEVKNFAEKNNIIFEKTSAFTGIGIDSLFQKVAIELCRDENMMKNKNNGIKLNLENNKKNSRRSWC